MDYELHTLLIALALLAVLGGALAIIAVFCMRSVLGPTINPEMWAVKAVTKFIEKRFNKTRKKEANLKGVAVADPELSLTPSEAAVVVSVVVGRTLTGLMVLLTMLVFADLGLDIILTETEIILK